MAEGMKSDMTGYPGIFDPFGKMVTNVVVIQLRKNFCCVVTALAEKFESFVANRK